ncbi:MAG: ABC transporter ATP-binding protein [Lachnospiraceae bacterium]|nr:ABC transporter ATP-binding protein [Lachnospiraceae bacterium]
MLEIKDVKKSYKGKPVVDGVSFSVDKGQLLGVIGRNGAGKSTLMSMIATLIKPDGGSITWEGEDIVEHPSAIRSKLGFVPQDIALYEKLSGLDNMKFWGKSSGVSAERLKERIRQVSEDINFDEDMLKKKVENYSGGMKRRLNIGVALLHDPEIIVLDEPTAGIDIESGEMVQNAIARLRDRGKAIICVGHYLEEIKKLATHICIMNEGKITAFGSKEELLANETMEELYKRCSINE